MLVKFTRKARGHFVTLIERGMHLIKRISGQTGNDKRPPQIMNNS